MSPPPAPSGRRILIADDDEHTRNLLRDLCEISGYQVALACDGEEALAKVRSEPPDLLLLDVMMPRKDGFAVLKELREDSAHADLPVVVLTATNDMDGKIRGMELGADDYVTKPFKLIDLQTRIGSALLVRQYRNKLVAAEEELAKLRALDPVTGVSTYAQLKASLDGELSRARRYGRPAAVLLFGFDDYQLLRSQLGRDKRDELVRGMATQIRASLRGADQLFRVADDEFVVLLPETDLKGARVAAERLGKIAFALKAEGRDGPFEVRIRVGGAVFPHERVHSTEDLLREANRVYAALRQADKLVFDP